MQRGRILLACSFLLITACSGADDSDLFGDPAVADPTPNDPAASAPSAPGGEQSGGAATGGGTASASGSSTGTDPAAPSAGSTKTDPPPAASCTKEIEPNGSLDTATAFTSCVAGELSGRDSDYADIVAPKTAKQIAIKHEETGKVLYRVWMNGMSLPIFTEELPSTMTVKPGATYTFEAIASSSEAATWKLEISFQ